MHKFARLLGCLALSCTAMAFTERSGAAPPMAAVETELDAYIAKPDPAYAWDLLATVRGEGMTTYIVDMKSQSWLSPGKVDRTVWQHWLVIVRPDEVKHSTGFVMIGGGANGGEPPQGADEMLANFAKATGTVVAELKMIPNQPLVFNGDGQGRKEDDLIAYAWAQYVKTADPGWVPRLPMVKSVVRAMDTIQALMTSAAETKVEKFMVAGGSKRGWTTWLTGAVDPRVAAISPIVIDVVNVKESMRHHRAAYGFWAPAVGDYVRHKIMDMQEEPNYAALLGIVDPLNYVDRLTMPKFVLNASGDQFFLPDSSQFYWDELEGPKYLRYVPNADHSLKGTDAPQSLLAFYHAIVTGAPLPEFSWTLADDGSIRVKTETKPSEVKLWQATNSSARDFRLEAIGPAYTSVDLAESASGEYVARVEKPEKGFRAYFVELTFPNGFVYPYKFSTQVRVTPDVLPFADDAEAGAAP